MKKLLVLLTVLLFLVPAEVYSAADGFDSTSAYPTTLDVRDDACSAEGGSTCFDVTDGDVLNADILDAPRDAIIKLETKLGIGGDTAVDGEVLTGTGVGSSAWSCLEATMMCSEDYGDFICSGASAGCLLQSGSVAAAELAAILLLSDGDLLDMDAIDCSSAGEGLLLPQATICTSATAEGQICWDTDNDTLYIGDGAAASLISGFGSSVDDTEMTAETFGDFTCDGTEDGCIVNTDAIALTTDTTGNYVSSATAAGGLVLTGTEGASLGMVTSCSDNQILKYTAAGGWACQPDATGGSPTFDQLGSGSNTAATMTVGTGATLGATGTGTIIGTGVDAVGAAGVTIGSADVTVITLTTDDTGDGTDLVLPVNGVDDSEVSNTITVGASGSVSDDALSANIGELADNEAITGNWVNTTSPWADNEVADTLTIDASSTVSSSALDIDLQTLAGPTTWRVFYSDGTSVITELALGANGTFLQSNGASAVPTWETVGTGSGDITAVGPGHAAGETFTDGVVSTGTTMFVWEGTTDDTNELSIISPSADPASDIDITLPAATGTLVTGSSNVTFGTVTSGANGADGEVTIYSEQGGTDYSVVFQPHAAMTESTTYVWPDEHPASTMYLENDGSGNLDWTTPAGAGNITAVGPAFSSGEAFTDTNASTGTTMLVWEGTTNDAYEFSLIAPTADPPSDINITFPSASGTLSAFGPSINDVEMSDDFGDFTCTGLTDGCTLDATYELELTDEASLYITLSDVSLFYEPGDTIQTNSGTATPGTCIVGDLFIDTNYDTDGSLFQCVATNTWKEVDDDGGGAPETATFITQTASAGLTNEQALSTLSSGIMRVATTTGVVTSLTNSAGIAANISDETGTGALVLATSPTLVTPTLGVAAATTLDTGQGANELYDMDQDVQTTDNVTFNTVATAASTSPSVLFEDSDGLDNADEDAGWIQVDMKTVTSGLEDADMWFEIIQGGVESTEILRFDESDDRWEIPTGKGLAFGTEQWDNGSDLIDGNQIADATIDDDSIDFGLVNGVSCVDIPMTDCAAITASSFTGNLTGNVTGNTSGSSGSCTGNAATATALAANPSDCVANQFAQSIVASGDLTCAAIADADVPNDITITLSAAATALATARTIGGTSFDGTSNITPANITVGDESADTSCYVGYFTAATGNLPPKTGTNLTFNSSTGELAVGDPSDGDVLTLGEDGASNASYSTIYGGNASDEDAYIDLYEGGSGTEYRGRVRVGADLTADRIYDFPDSTGTVCLEDGTPTFTTVTVGSSGGTFAYDGTKVTLDKPLSSTGGGGSGAGIVLPNNAYNQTVSAASVAPMVFWKGFVPHRKYVGSDTANFDMDFGLGMSFDRTCDFMGTAAGTGIANVLENYYLSDVSSAGEEVTFYNGYVTLDSGTGANYDFSQIVVGTDGTTSTPLDASLPIIMTAEVKFGTNGGSSDYERQWLGIESNGVTNDFVYVWLTAGLSNTNLYVSTRNNGGTRANYNTTKVPGTASYHWITIVISGGDFEVFYDGELVAGEENGSLDIRSASSWGGSYEVSVGTMYYSTGGAVAQAMDCRKLTVMQPTSY